MSQVLSVVRVQASCDEGQLVIEVGVASGQANEQHQIDENDCAFSLTK